MLSLGLGIPALLQGRPAFAAAANTLASGIQYDVLEKGSVSHSLSLWLNLSLVESASDEPPRTPSD